MSFFLRGACRRAPALLATALILFGAGYAEAGDPPIELMPDNSDVVAVIDAAAILKSPAFKKVQEQYPDLGAALDKPLGKKTKLTPRQIESVFIAANVAKKDFVLVMTMTTKITRDEFRNSEDFKEEQIGDYTLLVNEKENKAVYLIDDNNVAMAQPATLRAVLKRDDDAEISEELDAAWEDVDDEQPVYAVATLGALMKMAAAQLPPGFPLTPDVLAKLEVATLNIDASEDVPLTLYIDCADAATAQQIKAFADLIVQGHKANPSGPPPVQPAIASLTATVEEETVTLESKPGVGLILMMIQQQLEGNVEPKTGAAAAPAPKP
jgi:hypothetical protein